MNMIQRNKQLILTGLILGALFVVVIIFSSNKTNESKLNQVNEIPTTNNNESPFSVSQRNPNIIDEGGSKTDDLTKKSLVEELGDNTPKAIFIYTNEGWSPKSVNIGENNYVKWVNLADRDIVIKELVIGQTAFTKPVTIKPNEAFDTQIKRLPPSGYWTFKEIQSGNIGRIFVYPD
ncbi:hypothetical protein HYV31_03255 [candidate division WWE3 bacterium]|nr:hypothetical protein [candidate division WWE3 bacterium]